MNETKQRIAIAEACGLEVFGWTESIITGQQVPLYHSDGGPCYVPDYLNDLNAIHEAIMSLPMGTRDLVNLKLAEITQGGFDYSDAHDMDAAFNATAKQRAEAFLRTIGKWEEEE